MDSIRNGTVRPSRLRGIVTCRTWRQNTTLIKMNGGLAVGGVFGPRTKPGVEYRARWVMGFVIALGLIVVVLGVARSGFHARLPATAVAVIDFVLYWAMLILTALGLTAIVLFTALELFDYRLPQFTIVPIYLVLFVLVRFLFGLVRASIRSVRRGGPTPIPEFDDEPKVDRSHWPISGPIGRFGPYGLIATFYSTQMLCLFNPFQVVELIRQVAGNATLVGCEKRSGDDGRNYKTRVVYTLPFDGEWLVGNGGATPKTSHSWDVLGQRFALDFVQADRAFRTHAGRGTRAVEYFCYGREILAAASGTVVSVEDRVRQAFLGWGVCDFMARSFIGNYVLVEHAEGEFGLYAHLVRGSVSVVPGDRVNRGQILGRCGHSGNSTEPHLHFHLQDSADLFRGMGLPVRFSRLVVDGEAADGVLLSAGNRVRSRSESR